jgi:hypothetical protein
MSVSERIDERGGRRIVNVRAGRDDDGVRRVEALEPEWRIDGEPARDRGRPWRKSAQSEPVPGIRKIGAIDPEYLGCYRELEDGRLVSDRNSYEMHGRNLSPIGVLATFDGAIEMRR